MKKILLTFMLVMVAITASAITFDQGNFQYVTTSDSTVTLNGFKDSYTGSSTTLEIPGYTYNSSTQKYYRVTKIAWSAFNPVYKTAFATQLRAITRVEIRPGVEELDATVFYNCSSLNTVFLPSSIKKLGSSAFGACPITMINCAAEVMPTFEDNGTFNDMAAVSGTRYFTCATPDGKTAADAVSHITSKFTTQWSHTAADFHSYVIGNSSEGTLCDVYLNVVTPVKASNPYAYYGKIKLLGATPRSSNTSKTLKFSYNESKSFNNDYGYYYVTAIDKSFRYRATDLKVLDLSQTSKMEEIESQALYGCTALTTAYITAQKVGASAFNGCTGLTSLTLSERVKTLEAFAFAYTGMSSVTIPASLTSYGFGAFSYCDNLTRFYVTSGNSYFTTDSNTPNCLYNSSKTILYQMGAGTNPYSSGTLYYYMPNTLTTIFTYAMAGTKLPTVDIPYGVTTIHPYAFSGMPYVQTIRIPSSVTTVWNNTFCGISTTSFRHLYINLNTLPTNMQTGSAFSGMASGVTLHVPLWRTGYYKGGSWWSGGWSAKFTGGVVEDAYDFSYNTFASGNYIDYILYYTVSSNASYTDTKVQSTAVNGQLTVVGTQIGSAGHFNGTITFPNTTTHRGKTYITTEVQREVFRDQTSITRVTGGSGIKKIGALSFAGLTGCSGGFNIPYPVEFCDSSLFNCKTPTIALGDRLTTIGKDAFRGTNVTQMLMPPSVTSIGPRFIAGASRLDTLRLSPNITEIPINGLGWVNARYIVIPYGVKTIGKQAFFSDKAQIGGGEYLYEINCENVVVIPSSVTYIDPDAFTYARHLDAIFLNCPYGAFKTTSKYNWQRRTDYNASNCYDWSGHKLYVPVGQVQQYRNDPGIAAAWNENNDVGPGAFDFTFENNFIGTNYRMTVVNPTLKTAKYVYGEGNTSNAIVLSNFCTDHNSGITYNMVEIGDSAFVKHTAATHIYLDDAISLLRIGAYAFRGLTALNQEVNVPASVQEIGQYAFYGCTNLPSVFINRSSSSTSIGTYMFSTSQQSILYVPLNRMYYISQQCPWLANSASNRRLLPYVKPTSEWSAISVPVSDNILLPASGEFYYASSLNTSNYSLGMTRISNSQGIKGGEGMLMKGTVGTVYRFRRNDAVSNYTYVSPTTNYLKGVSGAYSTTLTYSSSGPYYYTFDGQKFNRVNSSATVYSGEAYAQTISSYSNLYINSDITTYNLWINGTQVTSENCDNLKVISGVSGTTVSYNPTSKTLTLSSATITNSTAGGIRSEISGLTIKVIGTNNVTVTAGNNYALQFMQNATITGTGTLNAASSVGTGCLVYTGKTLTVNGGVKLKITGAIYGILGYSTTSRLIISGATTKLTAKGVSQGSYYQLPTTMNDGLAITSPAGAYFNNGTVIYNGSVAKNIDVVISKPAVTRGDVNGDSSVNISDVTALIDLLLGGGTISNPAADCNQDSSVNISDVTALIDYLLSNHW